jgi:hypothetical protein
MNWTTAEEDFIRANHTNMGRSEMADQLRRNYDQVKNKMRAMGLVEHRHTGKTKSQCVHPRDVLTPEQYEMAKRFMWTLLYGGWRKAEIAKQDLTT